MVIATLEEVVINGKFYVEHAVRELSDVMTLSTRVLQASRHTQLDLRTEVRGGCL